MSVGVDNLSAVDLRQILESDVGVVLLDVREDSEREYASIVPGPSTLDLHVPMAQVPARVEEIRSSGLPVIVYCHHGIRSMVVARWLAGRGVPEIANLDGGIDAWSVSVDSGIARY